MMNVNRLKSRVSPRKIKDLNGNLLHKNGNQERIYLFIRHDSSLSLMNELLSQNECDGEEFIFKIHTKLFLERQML
jgi:hypothetical protein